MTRSDSKISVPQKLQNQIPPDAADDADDRPMTPRGDDADNASSGRVIGVIGVIVAIGQPYPSQPASHPIPTP
jgi:hypothetical protein